MNLPEDGSYVLWLRANPVGSKLKVSFDNSDLTPDEARAFLTDSQEKTAIPERIFERLTRERLKDAVRGQMTDWRDGEIKSGALFTQLIAEEGSKKFYQLSGEAEMGAGERSFSPLFHGAYSFDESTGEFSDFRLIAAGQRSGKGDANGRATDLGPAPMTIALTLYQK